MPTPETPPIANAGSWLARTVGAALLIEQAIAHLLALDTSMILVGVGLFLLTGREGTDFLRMLLGRARDSSSGPS